MDNTKFKIIDYFTKQASDAIELGIKRGIATVESHLIEKQQGDIDAQFIAYFIKDYREFAFKSYYKSAKKFLERCNEDFCEPDKFIGEITKTKNDQVQQYKSKNREQLLLDHITSEDKLNESLKVYKLSVLQAFQESFKYEVSLLKSDIEELEEEIKNDDRQLNKTLIIHSKVFSHFQLKKKVVLVGECDVGKTCIWQLYVKDEYPKKTVPTVGIEFETKFLTLKEGHKVKLQIWDTAGQERYRSITNNHFRNAVGALLVFDLTNSASFKNLDKWIQDLKRSADIDVIIFLVGNKLDLLQNESSRKVSRKDAEEYASFHKLKYFEISALENKNVKETFDQLISELCLVRNGYRGGDQSQMNVLKMSARTQEQCKC